jgi:hypothetical protein
VIKNKERRWKEMVTKRYLRLLEAKEKVIEKINEAKERGDQAEVDKLEEGELSMILSDIEENFNMTGKYELE